MILNQKKPFFLGGGGGFGEVDFIGKIFVKSMFFSISLEHL